MFPAKLAHYFIETYTRPGEVVADPFSGRGTTVLQSRVEGRRAIGNDLSPLAYVLSKAKSNPPSWDQINVYIDALEKKFWSASSGVVDVSPDIKMLFHQSTLLQLMFLREELKATPMSEWSNEQLMVAGATSGILHGAHRSDGSSAYLSISMPNTFSMSPTYVKKYIKEHGLRKIEQDVFECLRDKIARLYLDSLEGLEGSVTNEDAAALFEGANFKADSVDLVVTSPPYLSVVNYGTSNWIRLWWLGIDDVSREGGAGRIKLDSDLDHRHGFDDYREFVRRSMKATKRVLKPDGVAVFVIGDVATPSAPPVELAERVWNEIGDSTGLQLIHVIEDSVPDNRKVSRIWGEQRGRATERDCLLVLGRKDGSPRSPNLVINWVEPYKDAGPDIAHDRIYSRSRRKR
jgi:site-specific DNA-methyltransferase (adenine-specific)